MGGMSDFLLELLSEEIPARMQDKARADLVRLFAEQLDEAGLKAESVTTYATPRRLVLIASGLPDATEAVSEELKGPRTSAPPQALEGFLRKTGLTRDQLEEREGIWFATIAHPGRPTSEVLAEAIPQPYRRLLAHHEHMTVSVETHHGCPVDVEVITAKQSGDYYSRKIVLHRQSDRTRTHFAPWVSRAAHASALRPPRKRFRNARRAALQSPRHRHRHALVHRSNG